MSLRRTVSLAAVPVLASVALVGGFASSASAAPGTLAAAGEPFAYVADGGFEGTHQVGEDPTVNDAWIDSDTVFAGVLCDYGVGYCGAPGAMAFAENGPYAGEGWAWFGYGEEPEHGSSLFQMVTVPEGGATLLYCFKQAGVVAPFDATLKVLVDGEVVAVHAESEGVDADYVRVDVDLAAYADGGTHSLDFRFSDPTADQGDRVSYNNMLLDEVSISPAP